MSNSSFWQVKFVYIWNITMILPMVIFTFLSILLGFDYIDSYNPTPTDYPLMRSPPPEMSDWIMYFFNISMIIYYWLILKKAIHCSKYPNKQAVVRYLAHVLILTSIVTLILIYKLFEHFPPMEIWVYLVWYLILPIVFLILPGIVALRGILKIRNQDI